MRDDVTTSLKPIKLAIAEPTMRLPEHEDCFALLDDSDASASSPRSRLYTGYVGSIVCERASELPATLEAMQKALAEGLHAVGLFSYELGEELQQMVPRREPYASSQVLLFRQCALLSSNQVGDWLTARVPLARPAGIANLRAGVNFAEFADAIARIRAYIEAGDTYQVNYSFRLRFQTYGTVTGLYAKLRRRQPVPYGSLIALPDGGAVLCLSPELFVRHEGGELTARPMKGTAAAGADESQNAARANALSVDPKSRAENLMIVDLLRNDLGRIAEVGSVRVPRLFEVSRFANVLQMTSTVRARVRRNVGLSDVFAALYPCGSITGAPKRRTMQIIRELEAEPRDLYTGAIGWFEATSDAQRVGNFCLSVPIRTLVLRAPAPDGLRAGEMGIGAGIVYDSVAANEYEECQLKARFLTGMGHDFDLFETMHATREYGCRNLDRHLRRLCASAAFFGFGYDEPKVVAMLRDACAALPAGISHRLRLALNATGECAMRHAPLTPLPEVVKVMLAPRPTDADPVFLRHKTTVRACYDAAWRSAETRGAFDMLFCDRNGELTEGARTNLFVKLAGRWFTPPLTAGILPGVMRAALLDDPQWNATERRLTPEDLRGAEDIVVCNALRGALRATLVDFCAH